MNAWLVTWEPMDERAERYIKNRIAAILPNRTGEKEVEKTLHLLYANHAAYPGLSAEVYVDEQVRFARGDYPYRAVRSFYPEITCGGNPFLHARHAFHLKVTEEHGYQVLHWQEDIYPPLDPNENISEQIQGLMPFKRKSMLFDTRTNTITRLDAPSP